ncbi:MAG: phosphatidylcholine/phosphatidylserine synthase [Holosporales bacterium]|jgi:CDP-diacylglycerol--serine O-phosphatidyltransferase|nr:phosphatidylcholine/phosphatidylserine synthase [Holosporales bacterium]
MPLKKRAPFLRRKKQGKSPSLGRMFPSTLTIGSLCISLTGVRFALQERWEEAVLCILAAAILDSMDGRLARFLKCASYFGAELDSLADVVSFGVSPALILYLRFLHSLGNIGWSVCLFFCTCCALRLARFNVTASQTPPWAATFSTGVPAPAGALMTLFPLVLSFCCGEPWARSPLFACSMITGAGLLKISRIPTFTFKKVKIAPQNVPTVLVLTSLCVICLITEVWVTLSVAMCLYIATIPCSYMAYARLERQYAPKSSELPEQESLFMEGEEPEAPRRK